MVHPELTSPMMKGEVMARRRPRITPTPPHSLSAPSLDSLALPPAVARLRARILQAVDRRDIADLSIPIQWNEVPPLFIRGQPQSFDPIAFLKDRSFDGQGREMLGIIGDVFRQPFAVETRGATTTFQWPYFPVVAEREPPPRERLARWRCVRFADIGKRDAVGSPLIHRAGIGIDGTWHYFWTGA